MYHWNIKSNKIHSNMNSKKKEKKKNISIGVFMEFELIKENAHGKKNKAKN